MTVNRLPSMLHGRRSLENLKSRPNEHEGWRRCCYYCDGGKRILMDCVQSVTYGVEVVCVLIYPDKDNTDEMYPDTGLWTTKLSFGEIKINKRKKLDIKKTFCLKMNFCRVCLLGWKKHFKTILSISVRTKS